MNTIDGFRDVVELELRGDVTAMLWRPSEDHTDASMEMARWDPATGLLTIIPQTASLGSLVPQFTQITELHLHADVLPEWDPDAWVCESERMLGLELAVLPPGFSRIFQFGLGLRRHYREFLCQLETLTTCTAVRFGATGPEGPEGSVFRVSLARFDDYRREVDRNRARGNVVVGRVNETVAHNAVADLLALDLQAPSIGRHPVVQAMTRELTGKHPLNADERRMLMEQASKESRAAAAEAPAEFGRLRRDLEFVSLDVLIEQFERNLHGSSARDEAHWQEFFETNVFALQQLFSEPAVLYGSQLTVKGVNAAGEGSRIADFVLVNTVTRTAIVVEIKTPASRLTGPVYRGSGGAEVFPPHKDLTGAIAQVQGQMESVRIHLPNLLGDTPGAAPLNTVTVLGTVVTGTAGTLGETERSSFLRYREGLAGVDVIAFDEVVDRLRILRSLLADPPPTAHIDDNS